MGIIFGFDFFASIVSLNLFGLTPPSDLHEKIEIFYHGGWGMDGYKRKQARQGKANNRRYPIKLSHMLKNQRYHCFCLACLFSWEDLWHKDLALTFQEKSCGSIPASGTS
jgi:hypothetical protein